MIYIYSFKWLLYCDGPLPIRVLTIWCHCALDLIHGVVGGQKIHRLIANVFGNVDQQSSPLIGHLITLQDCPFCFLHVGNIKHGTGAANIQLSSQCKVFKFIIIDACNSNHELRKQFNKRWVLHLCSWKTLILLVHWRKMSLVTCFFKIHLYQVRRFMWKTNMRPMGHIAQLRNQFKSIHTFAQSYDYIITLILRWKKKQGSYPFWLPFSKGCFVPSFVENGPLVRRRFKKFRQSIFAISLLSPLVRGRGPFEQTWIPLRDPRMLCAKFRWNWPIGSWEEDENVINLQ